MSFTKKVIFKHISMKNNDNTVAHMDMPTLFNNSNRQQSIISFIVNKHQQHHTTSPDRNDLKADFLSESQSGPWNCIFIIISSKYCWFVLSCHHKFKLHKLTRLSYRNDSYMCISELDHHLFRWILRVRPQAMTWTNDDVLSTGHWGTDFSEILIKM